jgi:hypothetical protein
MRTKRAFMLMATGAAIAWFADPVTGASRRRAALDALAPAREAAERIVDRAAETEFDASADPFRTDPFGADPSDPTRATFEEFDQGARAVGI